MSELIESESWRGTKGSWGTTTGAELPLALKGVHLFLLISFVNFVNCSSTALFNSCFVYRFLEEFFWSICIAGSTEGEEGGGQCALYYCMGASV